jgi:ATP phosphoribosyltransferase
MTADTARNGGPSNGKLVLALPSKGRLLEQCNAALARAGLNVVRPAGAGRGYKAEIAGLPGVEVSLVSSAEIVQLLKSGAVHLGVTGEDLIREAMADADDRVRFLTPLGFGHADVVVAVPDCWLDVRRMADLERMALAFRRLHGRRVRVATKYMGLTRRFFAEMGVTGYRIVESLGATEGTPAAGLAEMIVDITTTGATLKANGLRILDDGVILKSQAHLMASRAAPWTPELAALEAQIAGRLRR